MKAFRAQKQDTHFTLSAFLCTQLGPFCRDLLNKKHHIRPSMTSSTQASPRRISAAESVELFGEGNLPACGDFPLSWGGTCHRKVLSTDYSQGSWSGARPRTSLGKRSLTTGRVSRLHDTVNFGDTECSICNFARGQGLCEQSSFWAKTWLQNSIHRTATHSGLEGEGVTVTTVNRGDESSYPEWGDDIEIMIYRAYCNSASISNSSVSCSRLICEHKKWKWASGGGSAVPHLVPGLDIGVSMMSLGECATISIPHGYGYSSGKVKGRNLLFEVELIRVDDWEVVKGGGCCTIA